MVAACRDHLHSPSVLWGERLKLRIKSKESSTLEGVRNHLFMPDWKP
jgi:hypothetical protein